MSEIIPFPLNPYDASVQVLASLEQCRNVTNEHKYPTWFALVQRDIQPLITPVLGKGAFPRLEKAYRKETIINLSVRCAPLGGKANPSATELVTFNLKPSRLQRLGSSVITSEGGIDMNIIDGSHLSSAKRRRDTLKLFFYSLLFVRENNPLTQNAFLDELEGSGYKITSLRIHPEEIDQGKFSLYNIQGFNRAMSGSPIIFTS